MSMHQLRDSGDDEPDIPEEYPCEDWTPKQQENWEQSGKSVYELIDGEVGRTWYRRTWRPKMRNEGMKKRDHVKLGTPEDYIAEMVADQFDPWGSLDSVMIRELASYSVEKEELEEAVSQITEAKLKHLASNDPARARQLVAETEYVASLYGVSADE